MPTFTDTNELNGVMQELWQSIKEDPEMSKQLLASGLIVCFHYREPEGRIVIDCSDGKELRISVGETDRKPIVEMFMKSDIAHDFWLGKINVPLAIISGKIVSKGPVNKALALLPAVKPAYAIYPNIYESVKKKSIAL